jgi:type IV pilus assembly protein PilY1
MAGNSSNQRPVLLIQYLDGAMELKRIPVTAEAAGTGKANDNGLALHASWTSTETACRMSPTQETTRAICGSLI